MASDSHDDFDREGLDTCNGEQKTKLIAESKANARKKKVIPDLSVRKWNYAAENSLGSYVHNSHIPTGISSLPSIARLAT